MTFSDYSVLIFLAAALLLAPRTLSATIGLIAVTIICGVIALVLGDMELLTAAGGVLCTLVASYFGAGADFWKYQWALIADRQSTKYADRFEEVQDVEELMARIRAFADPSKG